MLFFALMAGTLLPDVNEHVLIVPTCVKSGGPVSVAAARTVTDGMKDHSKARQTHLLSLSAYHRRRDEGSQ
jgi:hypothetical protein